MIPNIKPRERERRKYLVQIWLAFESFFHILIRYSCHIACVFRNGRPACTLVGNFYLMRPKSMTAAGCL